MKIVIGQMKHETNTFSPVPTPLTRFAGGRAQPLAGTFAIEALAGTGSAAAAFIELAQQAGAEIDFAVAGNAAPSSRVDDAAFEYMAGRICDSVRRGCDALLLDLHGAMVTQTYDDGEGELLRRVRLIAPDLAIGVALDMHTNLYPEIVSHSTAIAGYQTYPHIDMHGTGLRAGRAIMAQLQGRAVPTMAWGNRPMLPHVMRQGSDDSPNRELQARCRAIEQQGALAASVFVGFPHADILNAGLSAVVVTDNDPAAARRWCDELLDSAWAQRHNFVYQVESLQQSMQRAQALAAAPPVGAATPGDRAVQGPVVLLDHYDNCASGGTMDTMTVLAAMIDAGLENAAAFAIYDPPAAQAMIAAGVGAEMTLSLGGKFDMPSIGEKGKPLSVSGRVKTLTEGHYRFEGPMGRGEHAYMGPSAVLDTGKIEIAVISNHIEPFDIATLRILGIDPAAKRFLMLKSRIHWRAGLRHYARAVIECAGTGVCTSDYSTLQFSKVRRPIFPLDHI
jgi:microcystin degradation protein MlrC